MLINVSSNHTLSLRDVSNQWISGIFSAEYKFKAGQYLMHQGDLQNQIYIILDGWANNHKLLEGGHRQIVNFVLPSDMIGLEIDDDKVAYTVEALTDVRLLGIEKSLFWKKINANPHLMLQILKRRERHHRVLEKRIILLTAANSINSMAQMLYQLYSRLISVGIPGISHIHAHRIFNKLEKMNLVTRNSQRMQIVDIQGLLKVSNEEVDIKKSKDEVFC